jgi:hypothetical protein
MKNIYALTNKQTGNRVFKVNQTGDGVNAVLFRFVVVVDLDEDDTLCQDIGTQFLTMYWSNK